MKKILNGWEVVAAASKYLIGLVLNNNDDYHLSENDIADLIQDETNNF